MFAAIFISVRAIQEEVSDGFSIADLFKNELFYTTPSILPTCPSSFSSPKLVVKILNTKKKLPIANQAKIMLTVWKMRSCWEMWGVYWAWCLRGFMAFR